MPTSQSPNCVEPASLQGKIERAVHGTPQPWMGPTPKTLVVQTFYPEFLSDLYSADPELAKRSAAAQMQALFASGFSTGDAYSHELRRLGCETWEVICNADAAQSAWAAEHGIAITPDSNIHDRRRHIVEAQIRHFGPEIVYVFEWCPLGDAFWRAVRDSGVFVVGEIASPLPPNRTFDGHDLMISSLPPIVDWFRSRGQAADFLRLGFDARILDRVTAPAPDHDVTFVGGFAPSHPDRIAWLEEILRAIPIDLFCYGIEQTGADSPLRRAYRHQAWGLRMYDVLRRSRITLNRHARIEVAGIVNEDWCNNLRLYEATGVGTCLFTEWRPHLCELFAPDEEVVTYRTTQECVEKLRYYLANEDERAAIARAGQRRTLAEHTFAHRMRELLEIVSTHRPTTTDRRRPPATHESNIAESRSSVLTSACVPSRPSPAA